MTEKRAGLLTWLYLTPPTGGRKYILNAAGAVMSAVSMTVVQLFTTRILGAETAGRVSVDAATVLLCFNIGQMNMRPFQCTDVKQRFSFSEYLTLKTITSLTMLVLCFVYTFVRNYSYERCLFCMGFCIYKSLEAFSDCLWGMMQQRERFDLTGLGLTLYHLTGTVAFIMILLHWQRLDIAGTGMAVTGILNLFLYTLPLAGHFEKVRLCNAWKSIGSLLLILFPLFAAGYFINFSISLPKYALEQMKDDSVQGQFAAIYMTAQGVLLVSGFLYAPQLPVFARYLSEENKAGLVNLLKKLVILIILLDICIAAGGWLIGIPALGGIFHLELTGYREELILIIFGGGFFSLYTLSSYVLIAMRRQKGLPFIALAVFLIALILNTMLVSKYGIRGAALSYLLVMALASLLIGIKMMYAMHGMKGGPGGKT